MKTSCGPAWVVRFAYAGKRQTKSERKPFEILSGRRCKCYSRPGNKRPAVSIRRADGRNWLRLATITYDWLANTCEHRYDVDSNVWCARFAFAVVVDTPVALVRYRYALSVSTATVAAAAARSGTRGAGVMNVFLTAAAAQYLSARTLNDRAPVKTIFIFIVIRHLLIFSASFPVRLRTDRPPSPFSIPGTTLTVYLNSFFARFGASLLSRSEGNEECIDFASIMCCHNWKVTREKQGSSRINGIWQYRFRFRIIVETLKLWPNIYDNNY